MIWFCYLCKKNCFLLWVWPIVTPFLNKLGPKMVTLEVLPIFLTTTGLQIKLLVLIESPNIFHWKPVWEWSWGTFWAIILLTKFLPIMIGTNWQKQILYLTLAKYWQNIGDRYNALLTIGNSHEKINQCLTNINRYLTNTKYQFYKVLVISINYWLSIGLYWLYWFTQKSQRFLTNI